ncbi:XRE family transcriptional regulator [Psychrobacillus sp. AK 1817]|uniref:Helix-turn-helix transcriptional regulator n=1 Tax=Psychrobacillus faecigallinarum TaxID=2762235 RepID=A0ABR8RDN6_9BACI|nr:MULTISPECIES: XRE family transcriptional regulator [Psychrobacillus]MBD7945876.1 helix-turn-helix transcriptional regulator [Psychrobacillus faecigallinarum]QEY22162.1 XRE family transcriptional regulator [Psychrobacillus sp. AK 1817]
MSSNSIGTILKDLRKERKLTLKELAELTEVSISFLSQVERGKSSVTLESLKKIADALKVNPTVFFSDVSSNDQLAEIRQQFYYKDLSNGLQDASYTPILVTLQPGEDKGNAFSHSGHEFLFVVEGTLTVVVDGKEEELKEQGSTMFDANLLHYWYNLTDKPVRFLVISSR